MYDGLLRYAIPAMIALAFFNFIWAWILTAVKSPESAEEKPVPAMVHPQWKSLDAGPEGIRTSIMQGIQPKTKTV
jgi:hypothetical protein